MASKKEQQENGFLLVIVIAGAVIAPLALLIYWIICEVRGSGIRRARSLEDVNPDLIQEIRILEDRNIELQIHIEELIAAGKEQGLRLRQNGWLFDARSRVGQEYNEEIQPLVDEIERAAHSISEKKELMHGSIEEWLKAKSGKSGARTGVIVYILAVAVSFVIVERGENSGNDFSLVLALFVSGALAWISVLVVRWARRSSLVNSIR